MNKLFSKIAALSVGLAMAVGVGVAVNPGSSKVKEVKAATYTAYTLDGTVITSGDGDNNYGTASILTQSELEWAVTGNTTMNPWRIGGKGAKNNVTYTYDRSIATHDVVSSEDISEVKVGIGTISTSNFTINSFVMTVSTEQDGEGTVESSLSGTIVANNDVTFTRPDGKDWSNKYFTFTANVSCTGTKSSASNVFFQLKSITFYYEVSVQEPDAIEVSGDSDVDVGSQITLNSVATKGGSSEGVNQNVVWSSSDNNIAKVDSDGHVTGIKNGQVTIKATAENDNTVYGVKTVDVINGKSDDSFATILPSAFPTGGYGNYYVLADGVYYHSSQVYNSSGVIQLQKDNGLIENVAPFSDNIKTVEITTNADKTQGTGYKVEVSSDGTSFTSLEAVELYANRISFTCSASGMVYFRLKGPSSGTLYLDSVLIGFGNSIETKLVSLASELNDLLDAECTGSGDNTPITSEKWAEIESAYLAGDPDAKAELASVNSLSYNEVNQFLERYDHIVGGYGYSNFLNRVIASSNYNFALSINENNNVMIIIVVISSITVLSLGVLIALKKRKHN